jgi:endonuclease/exonuclease/phosphatase (EEP) superfamily protein YafD
MGKTNARLRHRRSISGALVCVGIFALGGLALWGLFQAPRAASPPPVPAPGPGVPQRPLRVVSYNVHHNQRGRDATVAAIASLRPALVLLQEVPESDFEAMARALGMRGTFHPHLHIAGEGLAVLSSYPVVDVGPIRAPHGRTVAVVADVALDGALVRAASVHLEATREATLDNVLWTETMRGEQLNAILKAWADGGSPPLLVGGDFNQPPLGPNYRRMTASLTDLLGRVGRNEYTFRHGRLTSRIDYLLASHEWEAVAGGVVPSDASDHRPIWADVTPAPPTTAPTSRSSPAARP